MEQPARGPAFLIRFDDARDKGRPAGVATHVQSGERWAFAGLGELTRLLRDQLEQADVRLDESERRQDREEEQA